MFSSLLGMGPGCNRKPSFKAAHHFSSPDGKFSGGTLLQGKTLVILGRFSQQGLRGIKTVYQLGTTKIDISFDSDGGGLLGSKGA